MQKSFEKFNTPSSRKALKELGIADSYINITKDIFDKPLTNIC
jgi:hypothetical protein